jgi:excisionase family DNA binding protein
MEAAVQQHQQHSITRSQTIADKIENEDRALSAKELAAFLRVSSVCVYQQAAAGRIPSFKIGTCIRFCSATVSEWLRKQ